MRLRLSSAILIGLLLIIGWNNQAWAAATATATPRPTPTYKACHICDEEDIALSARLNATTAGQTDQQGKAASATVTPLPTVELGTLESPPVETAAVVHAVMFWMQGCPHCHEVIDHVLPPLQQKYGDQLEIHLIEVSTQDDIERFYKIAAAYGIPHERAGVPFLIIGDQVLIGDKQIPVELPDLIEKYLAAGGVDYPNDPSLAGLLPASPAATDACEPNTPCADQEARRQGTTTPTAAGQTQDATHQPSATPSPARPKSNGFTLAIVIMAVMVGAVVYTGVAVARGPQDVVPQRSQSWSDIAVPILVLAGVGVAGYLAYVEMRSAKAICGPVGDCNAVQSSPYARMFGVLPVGVLGMLGYIAILVIWLWGRLASNRWARYAPLIMFGLTLFGVLFSLYLTYLEPFVIRAVCAWCLTSAVIMTLLLLLSVGPAVRAVAALSSEEQIANSK